MLRLPQVNCGSNWFDLTQIYPTEGAGTEEGWFYEHPAFEVSQSHNVSECLLLGNAANACIFQQCCSLKKFANVRGAADGVKQAELGIPDAAHAEHDNGAAL